VPLFICSLPNNGEPGAPRELISDDPELIEAFARREDRPGRGVYDCVSPLKPGARSRGLDTIDKVVKIHVDIDAKDIVEGLDLVDKRLATLLLPPTEVRNSGHGRHVDFVLKEPVDSEDAELIDLRNRLTAYLCGDPAVAHSAALLRRPGTHNSKSGDWIECAVITRSDARYDLFELVDWLDDVGDTPLFTGRNKGNGRDKEAEAKPPLDVEARLAAMKFEGPGETSIHRTQLSAMASLLRTGVALTEATRQVMDATRAAVAGDPRALRWDWQREELRVLRMGGDFIVKNPEVAYLLPDAWRQPFEACLAAGARPRIGRNRNNGYQVRPPKPTQEEAKPQRALLWPYQARPFSLIPRRRWLHAGHYVRGQVVMTVAPGGYGKTSLILCNAIEMATGRGLIGPAPNGPLRVAYWNAEDPDDEIERRIAAACLHHQVNAADLRGQLFLGSKLSGIRRIATMRNGDIVFDTVMLAEITRLVSELGLDCMIFDPLIAFHRIPETDNTLMEETIKHGFGDLATGCDICVELSQHTRKGAQGRQSELSADDSRGAGAVVNAARSVRVLNRMTAEEAELPKISLEDRRHYLRVQRDKTNLAPPGKAVWIRLVSVELPNATAVDPGDNVQSVAHWDYPQPLDGVTADDKRWMRETVRQGNYRVDPRSPDWLGQPLAKRLGLDPEQPGNRKKINGILRAWFADKVLAVDERKDDARHTRQYAVPGPRNEED
jgi:hypothetical protein